MLRYGALFGIAIIIVDWLIGSVVRLLAPTDPLTATLAGVDLGLNVVLFAIAGGLGYRHTGAVRGGAETAVVAAVLAGIVATARQFVDPLPSQPGPTVSDAVATLALNVALGGLSGIVGAWTSRSRLPKR
jgi:hypothetical protein